MRSYFSEPDRVKAVLEEFGEARYFSMVDDLNDPSKIARTHQTILPLFLFTAISQLKIQYT